MTALTRIAHKIFGSNAPLDEIGQFGSAVATTKLNTKDVATIQNLPAYEAGWGSAVVSNNNYPALEEMTGAMNVMSYQTGYLFERGIPEWINTATYYTNCFCSLNGKIYVSQTDNNINHNPTSDTTNWKEFKASGYRPTIFDMKWSDHLINDIQWLRSDTFSWQSGSVYVTAYNELVSEYNNASSTTETEGSITFKRTPKGYKIADSTQETAILNKYNTDGIAWYYILDTANTRFKLPRCKYKYWKNQNTLPVKGNGMALGLQQGINGEIPCGLGYLANQGLVPDKGFYGVTLPTNSYGGIGGSSGYAAGITTDSTKSGVVVDTTNAVEETGFYLYFYVGEYTQTAIEQTAGLNAELFNGKLDISSAQAQAPYLKTTYVNGTSGYNIWSNGYCEQWGRVACGSRASATVTLLKTYSDTNYKAIAISIGAMIMSAHDPQNGQVQSIDSTSQITVCNGETARTVQWETSGYLATDQY